MTSTDRSSLAPPSENGLDKLLEAFRQDCPGFTTFEDTETILFLEERRYKDELTRLFQQEVAPLIDGFAGDKARSRDIVEVTRRVFVTRLEASRKPQNLINWRYFDFLTRLSDAEAVDFAAALYDLLRGDDESAERVERFNAVVWPMMQAAGVTGPAATRSFCTILLMLDDPSAHIYVRTQHFEKCYRLLYDRDIFENAPLGAEEYRRVQHMAQDLLRALVEAGYLPKDMIDVQSFIWCAVPALDAKPEEPGVKVTASDANPFEHITRSLAVADHFQPTVVTERVVEVADDAIEVIVKPYMIRYNRIMVPVALTSQLFLASRDSDAATQMRVRYPEGEATLSYWRDADRNVTALLFRGDFREWFASQFEEGDSFELALASFDGDDAPTGLAFDLLQKQERREKLPNQEVVAVRPDWTDKNGLLGYYNPITLRYARTPFLDLLLRANREMQEAEADDREPRSFFVVLDEMNLARVEHYFSDFLSCMETGKAIHLHDSSAIESGELAEEDPVPRQLLVPRNVFFTGTVNVDETTYMFSPKVLDRAFTIELNEVDLSALGRNNLELEGKHATSLRLAHMPAELEQLGPPNTDDWLELGERHDGQLAGRIMALNQLQSRHGRHFGYRVAVEIARFLKLAGVVERMTRQLDAGVGPQQTAFTTGLRHDCEEMGRTLYRVERTGRWLWDQLGPMGHVPMGSTVLQRQRGYREVYAHFARLRMASRLPLSPSDARRLMEVKDIALLYELWTYFQLVEAVTELLGAPTQAIETHANDMMQRTVRPGMTVSWPDGTGLAYNPSFRWSGEEGRGSYSVGLRPDVALVLPRQGGQELHLFDAKFRLDRLKDVMPSRSAKSGAGPVDGDDPVAEEERAGTFKRADLYKMHTYRDAILDARSVWIVYPGDQMRFFSVNRLATGDGLPPDRSMLDGVGALPLRPEAEGNLDTKALLRLLLQKLLAIIEKDPGPSLRAPKIGWESVLLLSVVLLFLLYRVRAGIALRSRR